MKTFLITNENFQSFEPYSEVTVQPVKISINRVQNALRIELDSIAPFAVFVFKKDTFFAISNRLYILGDYIEKFGYHLEFKTPIDVLNNSKSDVVKVISCSNVQHITNWKSIEISETGQIDIVENIRPYQIPLESQEGIEILLDWFIRYRVRARQEAANGRFVPTLTGGVDTRILSWFWRDLSGISTYYLKNIKPDEKFDISKGQAEIKIAEELLKVMGLSLNRVEKLLPNQITFSGILTEGSRDSDQVNNPRYIYEYIAHHFSTGAAGNDFLRNLFLGTQEVCPFVDNGYLQLAHPGKDFMRTLLVQLCCPGLLSKRFYSFSALPMYNYVIKFSKLIDETKDFIDQYDLSSKVKKIKEKY